MNKLSPNDVALCNDTAYDPEWWFPEPDGSGKSATTPSYKLMILNSVEAMEVCSHCPLMANGKCLDLAMSDTATIDYGIYAGTLPYERREATGVSHKHYSGTIYQRNIRKAATEAGLIKPYIPKSERPKQSYYDYFSYVSNLFQQQS